MIKLFLVHFRTMTENTESDDFSVSADKPSFTASVINEMYAREAERQSEKPLPIIGGRIVYPKQL
jgi:hypothetical protein